MRRHLWRSILVLSIHLVIAQQVPKEHFPDSLKNNLSLARTDAEKAHCTMRLASYYVGIDNEQSRKFADKAVEVAELSRDRKLIAVTWIRYSWRPCCCRCIIGWNIK